MAQKPEKIPKRSKCSLKKNSYARARKINKKYASKYYRRIGKKLLDDCPKRSKIISGYID